MQALIASLMHGKAVMASLPGKELLPACQDTPQATMFQALAVVFIQGATCVLVLLCFWLGTRQLQKQSDKVTYHVQGGTISCKTVLKFVAQL